MNCLNDNQWVFHALTDIASVLEAEGAVQSSAHLLNLQRMIEIELASNAEILALAETCAQQDGADGKPHAGPTGQNNVLKFQKANRG